MLSNTCKYGIRAVIYIAVNATDKKKIDIKKISKDLEIPMPFLAKILQTLARHKLLHSTKGPHGGFSLAKPADEILLIDVVKILDGEDFFNLCFIGLGSCSESHSEEYHCPIHDQFEPIKNEIIKLFNEQTIQKLIDQVADAGKKIKI